MKVVIDTSILIDVLRGGSAADDLFNNFEKDNAEIFIPTIVIFELFSGQSSKDSTVNLKIKNLIQNFTRIELGEDLALHAGELYRQFGKTIGVSDYIIAATALELNAFLVTLNKKHFQQIPGLRLYS